MYTTVQSLRSVRQIMALLAIVGLLFSVSQGVFVGIASASDHQITICHATGGDTYSAPNPTKAQIYADMSSSDTGDANAHGSLVAGVHPDDIIPPFSAGSQGANSWGDYPGKNWDAEGQAIWNNKCTASVPVTGKLVVNKVLENEPVGVVADDFSFTVDSKTTAFEADGSNDVVLEVPVSYQVVEVDENVGYTTTYSAGCTGELTEAGATCTITNTYPLLCEDRTAVNYGKEETCQYESVVTMCKYDNNQNPLSGWTVGLQQGQTLITGVTGENGCVTLVNWLAQGGNVPYGTYTLTETMKTGWENVSGLGDSVDVDALTENFTLVNREIPAICDDPTANNYNQAGQCTYSYTDVTLCKVSGANTPLAGWTLKLGERSGETTVETGCVTFDEVKYGDYVVDEVMKADNWVNVAGEGYVTKGATVTVNEENPTFTLKNKECAEGEIVRENECIPENDNELITMCKYDVTGAPVVDWGMTLTNRDDQTFDDLVTGENGCVNQEVDPADGPWYVIEESRTDWTQESVEATGGATQVTDFGTICRFFPKFVDTLTTSAAVIEIPQEYRCEFTNSYDNPEPPVCRVGNNLLQNGSFEDPVVGGNWGIFNPVANWAISLSDGLELWANGFMGGASDGDQNAELDGNAPTRIAQDVVTTPGATYELRFDFSARPDADSSADNSIDAEVDGVAIMNATADGSDIAVNTWSTHTQTFVAAGASTEIAFVDKGTANSVGSLMDNAVLCLVSDPEPEPELSCDIFANKTVVSKGETFTLNWNTDEADYVEIDNGIGSVATTSGSLDRTIESDTTYVMTAWDNQENSVTCQVTVTVEEDGGGGGGGGSSAPRCELFTSEIDGENINLTWETTRGSSLKITADGDEIFSTDDDDEVDAGDFVFTGTDATEFELTVNRGSRERTCVTRIERPTPQVLGEQVSLVPQGAPDAGNGGAAPVAIPQAGIMAALLGGTRGIRNAK